jgi:hypothetical protein
MAQSIHRKNNSIKIALLFIFGFLAIILITTYPTVDDFIFSNINNAVRVASNGHFDAASDRVPGFTSVLVILYEICNIPYEVLVTLPLLIISFVLVFLAILKRSRNSLYPLIAIVCLLYFCMRPILFCHTIGLFMLLVIVFLALLRMENPNHQFATSILIIVMLISLNYVSYKLTAFGISFISVLYLIEVFEKKIIHLDVDAKNHRFGILAIIGLIFVLSFNQFFYNSFIPTLQKFESPFLGIEKMFSLFFTNQSYDPLSIYYFKGEIGNAPLYIAWMAIIGILLIMFVVVIYKKIVLREYLSNNEKITLSFGASAGLIFIIYVRLGLAGMGYIILTGLLGCGVLLTVNSKHLRLFAKSSSVLLLAISISMLILASQNDDYGGQKDIGHFRYLKSPAKWYVRYAEYDANIYPKTYTDVLTSGYYWKTALSENKSNTYRPAVFSSNELLFLLDPNGNPYRIREANSQNVYIINYKLRRFAIMGWHNINSWSKYRTKIISNPYLNIIYSSGWIATCTDISNVSNIESVL